MQNSEKLSASGVKDDDLFMIISSAASRASTNDLSFNPDGSVVNPEAFQQHIRRDSNLIGQICLADHELAQAILGNDLNKLQNILRLRNQQLFFRLIHLMLKHKGKLKLPFDSMITGYLKVYNNVIQKGIDENWAAALDHNPEGFPRHLSKAVHRQLN
ncbi:hypothetical protein V6N12_069373 [Hibiscus sabdariffa]|uniref:Uncharacterized protein n=1 Tax=Hibiscus sabdariffa TaxID=183260 RepID=A0ABR2FDQ5_9ROSI